MSIYNKMQYSVMMLVTQGEHRGYYKLFKLIDDYALVSFLQDLRKTNELDAIHHIYNHLTGEYEPFNPLLIDSFIERKSRWFNRDIFGYKQD